MKKKVTSAAALCALMVAGWCPSSQGATIFSGTVSAVGTYGSGALFIFLSGAPINEPGCNQAATRIDIPANHPNLKQWLATALAAKAAGLNVWGSVNGCDPTTNNPTLDQTTASYLYTY